jgi:hypothetical protein
MPVRQGEKSCLVAHYDGSRHDAWLWHRPRARISRADVAVRPRRSCLHRDAHDTEEYIVCITPFEEYLSEEQAAQKRKEREDQGISIPPEEQIEPPHLNLGSRIILNVHSNQPAHYNWVGTVMEPAPFAPINALTCCIRIPRNKDEKFKLEDPMSQIEENGKLGPVILNDFTTVKASRELYDKITLAEFHYKTITSDMQHRGTNNNKLHLRKDPRIQKSSPRRYHRRQPRLS